MANNKNSIISCLLPQELAIKIGIPPGQMQADIENLIIEGTLPTKNISKFTDLVNQIKK